MAQSNVKSSGEDENRQVFEPKETINDPWSSFNTIKTLFTDSSGAKNTCSITNGREFKSSFKNVSNMEYKHSSIDKGVKQKEKSEFKTELTVEEHLSFAHSEKLDKSTEDVMPAESSSLDIPSEHIGSNDQPVVNTESLPPPAQVSNPTRFSATSLLVESLIDQLCKLMEKDSTKQKQLYHVICNKLHNMNLIDDTYNIEEFQFMRSHYQRALYQLLTVAKSSTHSADGHSILLPLPSSNINMDLKSAVSDVIQWSRYSNEFQELEYIAKGGFGHVYKVRNKLDGGEYAIKKIFLRYRYVEGFLRSIKEVKMLARLNHPNIVSYKSAWLEPLDGDAKKHRESNNCSANSSHEASFSVFTTTSRLPLPPAPRPSSAEDSSEIVFQDSSPKSSGSSNQNKCSPVEDESNERCTTRKKRIRLLSEILETNSVILESETSFDIRGETSRLESDETSSDSADTNNAYHYSVGTNGHPKDWTEKRSSSSLNLRNWATLYVQMQFCERTLRYWLDTRNSDLPAIPFNSTSAEGQFALNIFKKIVQGVDYIHSQGIVHHDLKPSNIFVDSSLREVQVGDFGLSCCFHNVVDPLQQTADHSGEVGTRLYAAPEQLRGNCTAKSDLYSLGVLLIELLHPFHTDMERSKVLEKLRAGVLPIELSNKWPLASQLITELISPSAANRPGANELIKRVEILQSHRNEGDLGAIVASRDETIRTLQQEIKFRDMEIAELKQKLMILENSKSKCDHEKS